MQCKFAAESVWQIGIFAQAAEFAAQTTRFAARLKNDLLKNLTLATGRQ
jgi:hypothetical protein